MKHIYKLALPLIVAGGIGMASQAVQAEPTIIPYQLAQMDKGVSNQRDLDANPGMGDSDWDNDGVHNETDAVKRDMQNSHPGMEALDDNVAGPADANDADRQTFDATFWVLMAVLALGVVALIVAATRRKTTAH